jgi:hypothetical protein
LSKSLQNYPKNNKNDDSSTFTGSEINTGLSTGSNTASLSHRIKRRNGPPSASNISINSSNPGSNILLVSGSSMNGLAYTNQNGLSSSNGNSSTSGSSITIGNSLMIGSLEHEIDELFYEWANMTGFLSALGSVWLPSKQHTKLNFIVSLSVFLIELISKIIN